VYVQESVRAKVRTALGKTLPQELALRLETSQTNKWRVAENAAQRRMAMHHTHCMGANIECCTDLTAGCCSLEFDCPGRVSELAASFQTGSAYTSAYRTLVTMLKPRADTLARQKTERTERKNNEDDSMRRCLPVPPLILLCRRHCLISLVFFCS